MSAEHTRTFWLCPEHAEGNAAECTCGLVPYVPKAEVERLRNVADDAYRSLRAGRVAEAEQLLAGQIIAGAEREHPAAGGKKRAISVRIDDELDAWMRAEAHRRGITVADLIRTALAARATSQSNNPTV